MKKSANCDQLTVLARQHLQVLRHENKQYRQILTLLKIAGCSAQQFQRKMDEFDRRGSLVNELRRQREVLEIEIDSAPELRREAGLPRAYRTQVAKLAGTNRELQVQVQLRARENQLLFCRSLALVQRFLATLFPGSASSSVSEVTATVQTGIIAA